MTAPAPTPPRPRRIADLDVPLDQLVAAIRAQHPVDGALLEQRHQVLDLDTDSTCSLPGCACYQQPARKPEVTA